MKTLCSSRSFLPTTLLSSVSMLLILAAAPRSAVSAAAAFSCCGGGQRAHPGMMLSTCRRCPSYYSAIAPSPSCKTSSFKSGSSSHLNRRNRSTASRIVVCSSVSNEASQQPQLQPRNDDNVDKSNNCLLTSVRCRLRKLTGFSLTAARATMRAATGISLSAVYVSMLAATGAWIRQSMKLILSAVPAWMRYFVQPFLVLYYAPLFILRSLTGPTRKQARHNHDVFLEGWKHAVEVADETTSYWPIHVSKDGKLIEKDFDEVDVTEAVAESVEIAMEKERAAQ